MTDPTDLVCPGTGKCHNASWCPECDVDRYGPCDVRVAGGRCDAHRAAAVIRVELEEARHEAACADLDAARALHLAKVARREAERLEAAAAVATTALVARVEEAAELTRELAAAEIDERVKIIC